MRRLRALAVALAVVWPLPLAAQDTGVALIAGGVPYVEYIGPGTLFNTFSAWFSCARGFIQSPSGTPATSCNVRSEVFVGTGTIATNVLTISAVTSGTLQVGEHITDTSGAIGSSHTIAAILTGTGGIGTYQLNSSVGTVASGTITGHDQCDLELASTGASNGYVTTTENCLYTFDNGLSYTSYCNLGAAACFVTEMYDQTGNTQNIVQATYADQPPLILNCLDSLPCVQLTSPYSLAASSNFTPATGLVSYVAVAERTSGSSTTAPMPMMKETGGNNQFAIYGAASAGANKWGLVSATHTPTAAASDGAWHAGNAVSTASGSTSLINIDGTTTGSLLVASTTTAGAVGMGGGNTSTVVYVMEAGFLDNYTLTGPNITTLCENEQGAYVNTNFPAQC